MTNSSNWGSALQLAITAGWTDREIAENLHNLVKVLDRLSKTKEQDYFFTYMNSYNSNLNGTRPINAVLLGSHEAVLEAIALEEAAASV